jgi:pimeloyl-ACP methyl ester carboxylesterase
MVALLAACSSAADDGTPNQPPAEPVTWSSCPSGFRDECARLEMPLDHAKPEGETIEVLIARKGQGSRQLWLLEGGPGASAESFFNFHPFLDSVDPDLEVLTFEHRGVGESTRIGCDAEERGTPQGTQVADSEWESCRDDVVATWGDRLAKFDANQAAHDLALAIRRTRRDGVPVLVYSGSYGTYLANRFAVLHPEVVDGMVLDAPVQPGSKLDQWDLQFEPVGRRVFSELCPKATRCAEKLGPDPLAYLDRVTKALEAGQCGSLGVDFTTWRKVFGVFIMNYNLRNWLPALLYRLDRCGVADQQAIATLFGNIFQGSLEELPRKSAALQVQMVLSEFWPDGIADETAVAAARPTATFFQDSIAPMFLMQSTWPRYRLDESASKYAPPEVPMLVLAGDFDPSSPPSKVGYGYRDNLKGTHQTFVEIPYASHTTLTAAGSVGPDEPSCPVQLVRAFLKDPRSTLPVECASRVLTPSFSAPTEVAEKYFGTPDLYD